MVARSLRVRSAEETGAEMVRWGGRRRRMGEVIAESGWEGGWVT